MSSISTGVGLVSGINSAALIEQLIALESQGKIPIQRRMSTVQGAKTALLDINARLLNLKNAASGIRIGKLFQSMTAAVGDETILSARSSSSTPPGSYQFTVGRLASTSQLLSKGFATKDQTPLGLTELTFEWGDAGVARSTPLDALRGGEGVGRGKIQIRDGLTRTATIDLSAAMTLEEVVSAINGSDDIGVEATIENERVVVRDATGGGYPLTITDLGGRTLAADLGIAGTHFGQQVTGAQLNGLGLQSSLAALNDGNGVLIRDGVTDFRIAVDGTTYDISLGRTDQPITTSTALEDLNNGLGVKINTTDADDLQIVTSTGVTVGVNLGSVVVDGETQDEAVETVGEMLSRINAELEAELGAGQVVASLRADGKGFVLTDSMGGAGPVKVLGAGPNGDRTAKDLGLFTGAIDTGPTTLEGSIVRNKVAKPRAATIEDLANRISEQTSGAVTLGFNAAGTGLRLVAGSGGAVSVLAGTTDGSSFGPAIGERTARDLGLLDATGTGTADGSRISRGIGSVLLGNLNGGTGLGAPASISITDRSGTSFTFGDFGSYETLDQLVNAINAAATSAGVGVELSIADSGRGLAARDTSGGAGSLVLSGDGATALGLDGTSTTSLLRGGDLDRQYLSHGTLLSSLNFGKGVGVGNFRITDSAGESALVDVDSGAVTVYDVISEINSRGLLVEARLNETGDGLILVDTNTGEPISAIKVEDVGGAVARGLGIAGTATAAGEDLDGSLERTIELEATDTLNDIVGKINDAGLAVNASILNAGSGATPFRLNLTSVYGGAAGQLFVDSGAVDLGFVRSVEGRDATLVMGTGDAGTSFIFTSSTNTFRDVVSGLEIDAKRAGETTTVEVARDTVSIVEGVKQLVVTINDALGRISDYDKYDQDTEKKGPLLGDPTVARIRQQIIQTAQGPAKGVEGRYRFLSQVGIRFGKEGKLDFDEAKFRAAYDADPRAVEELFAGFEIQSTSSASPVAGVTVENTTTTYSKLGFGDLFDQLLKKLTNSIDGVTTIADRGFQEQLDGLKERLDRYDQRLESKRLRYQNQFAAMEAALAKLQAQQSSLGSLVNLMQPFR
jgi:flagellar hook-associated protein 2